jgi:hypothetical protein
VRVTVRVAVFADDHAALAAWTGEEEERIRAGERYHGGEHLLAWDGDRVVGLAHRWRAPEGTQRLMLTKCRPDTVDR